MTRFKVAAALLLSLVLALSAGCSSDASGGDAAPTWVDEEVTFEADGLTLPVAVYGHDDGCSVTGGFVYSGHEIPALRGRYVYGDYCGGWIRTFRLTDLGVATDPQELAVESPGRITSFGVDAGGELYVVVESGTVFRIEPGG